MNNCHYRITLLIRAALKPEGTHSGRFGFKGCSCKQGNTVKYILVLAIQFFYISNKYLQREQRAHASDGTAVGLRQFPT